MSEKDSKKDKVILEVTEIEPKDKAAPLTSNEVDQEIKKINELAQNMIKAKADKDKKGDKYQKDSCNNLLLIQEIIKKKVNEIQENLFRPYKNSSFIEEPLKPNFYKLKTDEDFFGVIWGCLNSERKSIKSRNLSGF